MELVDGLSGEKQLRNVESDHKESVSYKNEV